VHIEETEIDRTSHSLSISVLTEKYCCVHISDQTHIPQVLEWNYCIFDA
jgi:hypothetical protein